MPRILGEVKEQGLVALSSALESVLGGKQLGVVWDSIPNSWRKGTLDFGSYMYVIIQGFEDCPALSKQ